MDLALYRLLKPAKKASSPVARTQGRAGKDGFLENATYLTQGSLYGGVFEVLYNTFSVLLEPDINIIVLLKAIGSYIEMVIRRRIITP